MIFVCCTVQLKINNSDSKICKNKINKHYKKNHHDFSTFHHFRPSTLISANLLFSVVGVPFSSGGLSLISFGLLMFHIKNSDNPLSAAPITNINITLNQYGYANLNSSSNVMLLFMSPFMYK